MMQAISIVTYSIAYKYFRMKYSHEFVHLVNCIVWQNFELKFSWLLKYIFYPLKINHIYFISLGFSVAICLHFILLANYFVNVIIVSIVAIA